MPKKSFILIFYKTNEAGQTLVETLAALFVLVMGITTAVGLAIYAFNSSTNITRQIVATGLAREGLEAIKNMRDTNWLKLTLDSDCYNYGNSGSLDAGCYKQWLLPPGSSGGGSKSSNQGYDLSTAGSYRIGLDKSKANRLWRLEAEGGGNFGMNFDPNISGAGFAGYYNQLSPVANGNSDFYRQISINIDSSAPFNTNVGPRLTVYSRVWWADKKCPKVTSFAASRPGCRVELITNLTNWKNY